jgi:CheY-like chemotaxis protein/HPt (histidine-containing phosphotransfer) domain-containing protein
VVSATTDPLGLMARNKGLRLRHSIDASVPAYLSGDPLRIQQVLTNLTSNAVKFTDEGEVRLSVSLDGTHGNRAQVRFEVTDTGVGMSADDQKRVFEAFSQGDSSTTRKYGGTGLGLAIARNLAHLMGGRIEIRSKLGEGSTFSFVIPLRVAQRARTRLLVPDLRMLLVTDSDPSVLESSVEEDVRAWGFDVVLAPGPAVAEELLRQDNDFAVVVVDLDDAESAALALGRSIHELPSPPPAVLLSSGLTPTSEVDHLFEGALAKPFRRSALYDLLTEVARCTAPVLEPLEASSDGEAGGPVRVLVAEDNATNREVVAEMLRHLGYTVDLVENGREAVEAIESTEFDAVLLDCQMPELDGYSAARKIREREQERGGRRLPLIAATAHALKGDRERALEAGMDDYIPKPIALETLAEVLRRWVGTSTAAAAPSERAAAESPDPTPEEEPAAHSNVLASSVIDGLKRLQTPARPDFLKKLVEGYLAEAAEELHGLRNAATGEDAAEIGRRAHRLKGASRSVGALHLGLVLEEIEAYGKSGDVDGAVRALATATTEFLRVEQALLAIQ